jgi:hypothetical protein
MLQFFTSGHGLSGIGLIVGIIIFLIYMKMMKWLFKIIIFGIIILVWFLYYKSKGM